MASLTMQINMQDSDLHQIINAKTTEEKKKIADGIVKKTMVGVNDKLTEFIMTAKVAKEE